MPYLVCVHNEKFPYTLLVDGVGIGEISVDYSPHTPKVMRVMVSERERGEGGGKKGGG